MPVDPIWSSQFARREFWEDFFWYDAGRFYNETRVDRLIRQSGYADLAARPLDLPFPGDYRLSLTVTCSFDQMRLSLGHPSLPEPGLLGLDDPAQWYPYVFRWPEIDALCRSLAARDADLPYPGWPLLMLCRFAPVTAQDDRAVPRRTVGDAWRSTGHLSEAEVDRFFADCLDRSNDEVAWTWQAGAGWLCEGFDAYSFRNRDNLDRFPFARLNDLLAQVDAAG